MAPSADLAASQPLSDRQRAVLELAARYGTVRRLDLVHRFGVARATAGLDLARLVAAGFLRRLGAGRGVRYVRPGSSSSCQGT